PSAASLTFSATRAAPAFAQPKSTGIDQTPLPRSSPTRPPRATPSPASKCAIRFAAASTSPNVSDLSPQTTAVRPACRAAPRRTSSTVSIAPPSPSSRDRQPPPPPPPPRPPHPSPPPPPPPTKPPPTPPTPHP